MEKYMRLESEELKNLTLGQGQKKKMNRRISSQEGW